MTIHRVKKGAPNDQWMLVKVPKIVREDDKANVSAAQLREIVQENYLGGGRASVRRLTAREVRALRSEDAQPRRKCWPAP